MSISSTVHKNASVESSDSHDDSLIVSIFESMVIGTVVTTSGITL